MNKFPQFAAFSGEGSLLPQQIIENTHLYYPETWKDWTPGLQERSEWAWKEYNFIAIRELQLTPFELLEYKLGDFFEKLYNGHPHPNYRNWKLYFPIKSLFEYSTKLAQNYYKIRSSGRKIKLVWSHT